MRRRVQQHAHLLIVGAGIAVLALLFVLLGMRLVYPRVLSTVAIMVACVLATLLVRALLPEKLRPPGTWPVVLGSAAAYVVVRFGVASDWSEFLDHDVFERLGGEVGDFPTSLLAAAGAAGTFVLRTVLRRTTGRRDGHEAADGRARDVGQSAPR
jgi:hypothetical protein